MQGGSWLDPGTGSALMEKLVKSKQRKNGSSPLHAVNKEAEAQKLKDLPRSRRKAGVELVPEAKCPECHSGSAASICPLVLVTSASFRVGVK